jgi:hypothetical protein
MTKRLPCPPAPGPLESYAAHFDPLFGRLLAGSLSGAASAPTCKGCCYPATATRP